MQNLKLCSLVYW